MKRVVIICLLSLGTYQGIRAQNSETRTLSSFNEITVSGNSKVYLTPGSPQTVRVETKEELHQVKTEVSNGNLYIDGKPSKIYITVPAIQEITVSGYGVVTADSMFSAATLTLDISGNGKIVFPLNANLVNINISGYGKMRLNGNASQMDLNISGNGSVDADQLKVSKATVNVSGVGKALVDVSDQLDLNISGVGSVYYKTEPKVVNREVSGIGKFGVIDTDDSDTTTVSVGKKRIIIVGGNEKTNDDDDHDIHIDIDIDDEVKPKAPAKARSHWGGLDLGFNGYLYDQTDGSLPPGYDFLDLNNGKSISVGINAVKFDIKLYKRYIMLTTGLGLTLNNYRLSTDKTLISDTNLVVASYDYKENGERINYTKNKLAVNYLTVPVLLQFNTHKHMKRSFHMAAGMLFSYKFNSHLKLVYEEDGNKEKTKRRDDYNIEPFRYDATVRLGYRNYTLFASYALSELFKDKRGPTLHPFAIGVNLAGW